MTTAIPADAFPHGDVRRYHRGCTCRPCREAGNTYRKQRKYLSASGRPARVPAARAAQHIKQLRAAGMTDPEIARTAGVSHGAFYRALHPSGRIAARTEQRLLAVAVPATRPATSHALVPCLGTTRRLRALAADGYGAQAIAAILGTSQQHVSRMQHLDPHAGRVMLTQARRVRELTSALAGRSPAEVGVAGRYLSRTRRIAAEAGWVGTAYWDDSDYDDPAFVPAVYAPPAWFVLAENTLDILGQGADWEQAARRLDTPVEALRPAVYRYQHGDFATRGWQCSHPGCTTEWTAQGLCRTHYQQDRRARAAAGRHTLETAA